MARGRRLDPGLVSKALAELIINAAEADPKGTVVVRSEADPDTGDLVIKVRDRGPGVSAKALTHAFDAFFSDKPAGRSRGLGLTRAKSCVEAIGGRIVLTNAPGGGALAKIALPTGRSGRGNADLGVEGDDELATRAAAAQRARSLRATG
jgi:signal transduction histidine kinase